MLEKLVGTQRFFSIKAILLGDHQYPKKKLPWSKNSLFTTVCTKNDPKMWSKKVRWGDFYETSAVELHMKIFVGIGSVVFASITDKVFGRSGYSFISID